MSTGLAGLSKTGTALGLELGTSIEVVALYEQCCFHGLPHMVDPDQDVLRLAS